MGRDNGMLVVSPQILASGYELQDIETDSERDANVCIHSCMATYDDGKEPGGNYALVIVKSN